MGLSRPLLIFSERRLGGLILGDALYSRLLLLLCGIEGSEKLSISRHPWTRRNFFSASTIATLTRRTTIPPPCQPFTFLEHVTIPLFRFSMALVGAVSQDILDRGLCNSDAPELACPGHRPGRGPVAPTGPNCQNST